MDSYADKLTATKQHYPFDSMRQYWQDPEEQADCDALQQIFDKLIAQLIALDTDAPAAKKVKYFKKVIEKTNDYEGVIETGEREDLCALTNEITLACGLYPNDYGDGGRLASKWRNWYPLRAAAITCSVALYKKAAEALVAPAAFGTAQAPRPKCG